MKEPRIKSSFTSCRILLEKCKTQKEMLEVILLMGMSINTTKKLRNWILGFADTLPKE